MYNQSTSLYLTENINKKTNLFIYDTEREAQNVEILDTPEPLDADTCIARLPYNSLFFYGKQFRLSGITLVLDEFKRVQLMPSGTPCYYSSALYFDRSVFCFGGSNGNHLALSERFDFNQNCWIKLAALPKADFKCHCIILNGNILIAGYISSYILRYSIEDNDFTRINYRFSDSEESNKRKILIYEERLYLIEFDGWIYESNPRDENSWRKICNTVTRDNPSRVYWSYNKGAIYIGCRLKNDYYKFKLSEKVMIQLDKK